MAGADPGAAHGRPAGAFEGSRALAIPAGLSVAQVAKSIKVALLGRGWMVAEEHPGRIISTLNLRAHMAQIEVSYDDRQVKVRYLDSSELMYEQKKGERLIHRNYLSWVRNVLRDTSRNMQLVAP